MTRLGKHRGVEEEIELEPIRKLRARRRGRSAWHPGRFTPDRHQVFIVQEAGRTSGPIWTGAEKFAPTRIRFPDRPARNMDYAVRAAHH
jgi:hypothetical protein